MGGDRGHVDDCKCITLQLTCGSESLLAELENRCGALWCCVDGTCDVCWCWFSGIADHWIVGVCWDVDSSLKDQSDDIDSNYCCGRGYAAHCLCTTERARNTSAQHERHGETVFDNDWKFTHLAPFLYALLQIRLVSTLARLRTPLFWDLTPCHCIIRSRLREGT